MARKVIWFMSGLPSSGKSSIANLLADGNPDAYILSMDAFRSMVKGRYRFNWAFEGATYRLFRAAYIEALKEPIHIIVDECLVTRGQRMELISLAKEHAPNASLIGMQFVTPIETCMQRAKRQLRGYTHKYWIEVILEIANYWEPMTMDEGYTRMVKPDEEILSLDEIAGVSNDAIKRALNSDYAKRNVGKYLASSNTGRVEELLAAIDKMTEPSGDFLSIESIMNEFLKALNSSGPAALQAFLNSTWELGVIDKTACDNLIKVSQSGEANYSAMYDYLEESYRAWLDRKQDKVEGQ